MRFDLSPKQQQLKETAHRFAAEEIVPVAAKHGDASVPITRCASPPRRCRSSAATAT